MGRQAVLTEEQLAGIHLYFYRDKLDFPDGEAFFANTFRKTPIGSMSLVTYAENGYRMENDFICVKFLDSALITQFKTGNYEQYVRRITSEELEYYKKMQEIRITMGLKGPFEGIENQL